MEIFTDKNECCGCTACKNACPKNAITMQTDDEGFLYPVIDDALCVNCGICKNVCAFQNGCQKSQIQKSFAVKHKDADTRRASRSGGAFIAISDYILEKGGSVYGAAFDDDFSVKHIRAVTKEQRNRMQGSKYVQSVVGDSFARVKEDLQNGMYVLFSGTACQVAGLKRCLEKCDTSKLFTCDLICHGVPSPKIWREYLAYREKQYKGKVTNADFRDKSIGWSAHRESVWIDGKKHMSNGYTSLFYENEVERPCCYNCKYTSTDRPADFTLADFWGIDRVVKNFNDNKGVSLLLVNRDKAVELFDKIKEDIDFEQTDIQASIRSNPNIAHPTARPASREKFWEYYRKHGFEKTYRKYYIKMSFGKIRTRLKAKYKKLKKIILRK